MNYTIRLQTPNKTHYIENVLEEDVLTFKAELNKFLTNNELGFFHIEVPEGELLLPFTILMETEIIIY